MKIGIIMKMKLLAAAVLVSVTSVANAGFFDSLFGSDEKSTTAEETKTTTEAQVQSVTDAAKSQMTSAVDTVKSTATTAAVASATSGSTSSSLLSALTSQLGVTDTQATGGLGSLMQVAQGSLSTDDFSSLSDSVPNMSTLLAAAPSLTGDSTSGVTDLLSSAGGAASSISTIATLTKQFEALGLSSDMITQFTTIAMSYFTSSDNSTASSLLQKGLSSIL